MGLDTAILSRIQFGFTIGFHILFPTFNIGMAVFICIMEGIWVKTQNPFYLKICKFWTKLFALTFGMGVVSGVVLGYEIGTNFAGFSDAVGQILGPLFGYEVLTAFFLEAGFLGVMLFGWKRVSPKIHYMATLLVTIGVVLSAFWILSANSWMQTPAGFHLEGKRFAVSSWWDAIFNPSFLARFFHMVMASFVTSSFVIAAISSWYLLRNRHTDLAKKCLSFAIVGAVILSPIQIFIGDTVALNVHKYQPLKTAAIEAVWKTQKGAPFVVFAYPSEKQKKNLFAITVPYGASLINTHSFDGVLKGLDSVPRSQWPIVAPVFYTFRIMVGLGFLFFLVALIGVWLLRRGTLYKNRKMLHVLVWMAPFGFISTICGWLTAELGRQPWVVYGFLRTDASASKVPVEHVMISLSVFVLVYGVIFGFYLYYLFKMIRKGPAKLDEPPVTIGYIADPLQKSPQGG